MYIYIYTKSSITGGQNILELLKRWMGLGNLMKHGWIAHLYPLTISLRELLVRSQKRMFFSSRNDYSNSSVHNRILIRSSDDGKAYIQEPPKYSKYSGISQVFLVISYVLPIFTHRLTETNGSWSPQNGIFEIQQIPREETQETPVDPAIQPPDLIGIHLPLQFTLYFSIGCFMWFEHGFTMFYANLVCGLNRMNYLMGCASLPL